MIFLPYSKIYFNVFLKKVFILTNSFCVFQDGLYHSVGSSQISNYMRGAWKRFLAISGKARCRHDGCTYETNSLDNIVDHYLNCPIAPRKVYI